jgi:hypothetical protein
VTPAERLGLSRQQLARVQVAWIEPTDWSDLALYAFYAVENAVVAAAEQLAIPWQPSHPKKADLAAQLHNDHGLPDVSALLRDLNSLRKSQACGEAPVSSSFDAEDVAVLTEGYIEAVDELVGGQE